MPHSQSQSRSRTHLSTQYPRMYYVIMHNDDITTMEFVVDMLRTVFFKPEAEAQALMLTVHQKGKAVIGTYSLDIAVSKSQKAMSMAREQGFPFKLTWEPVPDDLPF